MEESSPARLYAGVVGVTLVAAGIAGFFYNASFNSDPADRDALLGLFYVNGWTNVAHILTGLLGLVAFTAGAYVSRYYAVGLGIVYSAVAVWGVIIGSGDSILSIIPVSAENNFLHLAIALTGLAASQMWAVSAIVVTGALFGFLIPGVTKSDHDSQTPIDRGKALFAQEGCSNCHTLASSGSLGTIGPNLDEIKPDDKRSLNAIENGGVGTGAMPRDLSEGADADAIAAYVAYATGEAEPAGTGGPPGTGEPPGKQAFAQSCGSCHTLADAGTSATIGPDLDQIEPNEKLVLAMIKAGPGAMPPNLVTGKEAREIAEYVASVAGR